MGKTLVVMESPAKAKKVQGYLGQDYIVKASVGHFREMPVPKNMSSQQKEQYGDYSIDVKNNFEPLFKISKDKTKIVSELKTALEKCSELIIFTDSDSEGASIGYHLLEVLKPKVPVFRAVTVEITKNAVEEAFKNKKKVDVEKRLPEEFFGAAEAAITRACWDRLYGYKTSPMLWKMLKPGTSSGRVQTPGARMVVEREVKRLAFKSVSYYSVKGVFGDVSASLVEFDSRKIAGAAQLSDEGELKEGYLLLTDENIGEVLAFLREQEYVVGEVKSKPYRRTPPAPFMTSTALQSIGSKYRMSTKQITACLQNLYQNGEISYIRTVSVVAAPEAITAARKTLEKSFGRKYVSPTPRVYKDKKEDNSGHECIRTIPDSKGEMPAKKFSEPAHQKV